MQEDPTFRVQHRSGHRPDAHRRHGRAAPGDPGRPPATASIRCVGQRGQAPGRLPRDDRRGGGGGVPLRPADRRPRPVRARQADGIARPARGRPGVFENDVVGGRNPEGVRPGGAGRGCTRSWKRDPGRLRHARHPGRAVRRLAPRGRFVGDGLQDRRSMAFRDACRESRVAVCSSR